MSNVYLRAEVRLATLADLRRLARVTDHLPEDTPVEAWDPSGFDYAAMNLRVQWSDEEEGGASDEQHPHRC